MGLIFNSTHLNCNVVPFEEEGKKKRGTGLKRLKAQQQKQS